MAVLAVASGHVGKWEMGQGPHSGRWRRMVARSGVGVASGAYCSTAWPFSGCGVPGWPIATILDYGRPQNQRKHTPYCPNTLKQGLVRILHQNIGLCPF